MDHPDFEKTVVNEVPLESPLKWLKLGWEDFKAAPLIGLAHGIAISFFGFVLLLIAYDQFWVLAVASTAFLSVAPVLAVGLYGVSKDLGESKSVSFLTVFKTWWSWRGKPKHDWRLVRFSLLLCLSGAGWVVTSAALITLFSSAPVNEPIDFIRHVMLSKDNYLFEIWIIFGAALGAPVFASTVVTLPILLDRKITILDAVMVSWKSVILNPLTMALWAALIMILTMMGVLALIGSAIVIPVLGHASWHAYKDVVRCDKLPPRVLGQKE